jgi:phytoene dehydrogenase-like protein
MTTTVNVVGGGLAGMVAAITAAEDGAAVDLFEARDQLGGRARTLSGDWAANWGPHALYDDGLLWAWLAERRLLPPAKRAALIGLRFRRDGEGRRTPPAPMIRSIGLLRARGVPDGISFRKWASERYGERAADIWSSAAGVVTFNHDPGGLSASFVTERLRRAFATPPVARFPRGGWTSLVDELAGRMRGLGVRAHTGTPVDQLPHSPVVVALAPRAARRLLADESIAWPGARTALLDVGLRSHRGDAYIVSDLDEAGWVERFTRSDVTLAPAGHSLVQAQIGLRPAESLDDGVARLEALVDSGFPGWRDREVWRRRALIDSQTGALDLPGTSWRDRPAIDRGDGVWLCGDYVAAPGLLAEVSWASAVTAGRAAAGARLGASVGSTLDEPTDRR